MTADVERMAEICLRAAVPNAVPWEQQQEWAKEAWRDVARAAMSATLELAAEALRGECFNDAGINEATYPIADWLQQRANDVKGSGNG